MIPVASSYENASVRLCYSRPITSNYYNTRSKSMESIYIYDLVLEHYTFLHIHLNNVTYNEMRFCIKLINIIYDLSELHHIYASKAKQIGNWSLSSIYIFAKSLPNDMNKIYIVLKRNVHMITKRVCVCFWLEWHLMDRFNCHQLFA